MKRIATSLALAALVTAGVTLTTKRLITPLDTTTPVIDVSDTLKFPKLDAPVEFGTLSTGGSIRFRLGNQMVTGTINTTQTDTNGTIRVGGDFDRGTFCFAIEKDFTTSGLLVMPQAGTCCVMNPTPAGQPLSWTFKSMGEVVCKELPVVAQGEGGAVAAGAAPVTTAPSSVTTQAAVPILDSRSTAKTVLYLDFIGGTIQDPLWNGGKVIDAKPANYTLDQIRQTFDVCAERFAAFNVNVTTDIKKYTAAPVKNRMRVVLTTTNVVPGYGGYAFIGSLRSSGTGIFSPTIPCFAFVNNVGNAKNAGEVAAHELGHTFGLQHDGTSTSAYYTGQGNWAPVMGTAYSKSIVQWSKGEYNKANNRQDDLGVISTTPGVGFSTTTNSGSLTILSGTIAARDVISNNTTSRFFQVNVVSSGTLTIDVNPVQYSGLNATVELLTTGSQSIIKNNPLNNINARVVTPVTAGKYVIKVSGDGEGDVETTGYTSYGSIGTFVLTGTLTSGGSIKTGSLIVTGSIK